MSNKVFVARRLPGTAVERLAAHVEVDQWEDRFPPSRDELLRRVRDCDGLLSMISDTVDAELLDAAPRLRSISNFAVGFDNVDIAACTERGVPFGNTPGVLTESTADQTFALILATSRRVVEAANAVVRGEWVTWEPDFLLGTDVHGATLGLVGRGAIGNAVARRAEGFGMKVISYDPTEPEGPTFEDVLEQSDIVSLHCPLTAQTRGLMNARAFERMKPSAILINAARGPIVDQAALAVALGSRQIAAAGLDVTELEPIPLDDPLLTLPNCLVLPHLGTATYATRSLMADMAVDNVLAGLAGQPMPHCVNPESLAVGRSRNFASS